MAYELTIFPSDEAAAVPVQTVVDALRQLGIAAKEEPDELGHWLVLDGHESAISLTVKDDLVTGAGFRYATEDDPFVIEQVIKAFKGLGWLVADDEEIL